MYSKWKTWFVSVCSSSAKQRHKKKHQNEISVKHFPGTRRLMVWVMDGFFLWKVKVPKISEKKKSKHVFVNFSKWVLTQIIRSEENSSSHSRPFFSFLFTTFKAGSEAACHFFFVKSFFFLRVLPKLTQNDREEEKQC